MLFYEATTGQGATGQLNASGTYLPLASLTLQVGWTHIVSNIQNNILLFYDATTGQGATGELDASGTYLPLTSIPLVH